MSDVDDADTDNEDEEINAKEREEEEASLKAAHEAEWAQLEVSHCFLSPSLLLFLRVRTSV